MDQGKFLGKAPEKQGKTMIDQFNQYVEAKKKAKDNKPRGPIDIKALRAQVQAANAKNRRP